jgi:GH24 family phage-related lysozyme (muramidase)
MAVAEYATYKLSTRGYQDLLSTEGNKLYVYDDKTKLPVSSYESVVGYPTIGLGLLIDSEEKRERFRPYLNGVKAPASVIEQANREYIAKFERQLNAQLGGVKLTPSMFDALFSLAWNTGTYSRWVKEVIRAAAAQDYAAATAAIANGPVTSKGVVLAGLVKRRAREAALFMADGVPGGATTLIASPSFLIYASLALSGVVVLTFALRGRKKRRR